MSDFKIMILSHAVVLVTGTLLGYILKDRTTVESETKVTIIKPKIKGSNSNLFIDQEVDARVERKELTWRDRQDQRKKKRAEKKTKQ